MCDHCRNLKETLTITMPNSREYYQLELRNLCTECVIYLFENNMYDQYAMYFNKPNLFLIKI